MLPHTSNGRCVSTQAVSVSPWRCEIGDAPAAEPIIALANHGGFGFAARRCILQVLIVVDCCLMIHETFFTAMMAQTASNVNLCGVAQITVVTDHLAFSGKLSLILVVQEYGPRRNHSKDYSFGVEVGAADLLYGGDGMCMPTHFALPPQSAGVELLPYDPLLILDVLPGSKVRNFSPPRLTGSMQSFGASMEIQCPSGHL